MEINKQNFAKAKYDIFSMFNSQWALATVGSLEEYNPMTIRWGMMGSIWGLPNKAKPVMSIFLRETTYTSEILLKEDKFTVCLFPEKYRYDLAALESRSGRDFPDKISLTSFTPKSLGDVVGYEEAQLTFVCKKIYTHKFTKDELPEEVVKKLYPKEDEMHYIFIGEIEDVFGTIDDKK